ncbi:MAG: acyltransferase family protein [Gemmatimonadaceae bacterium]
MPEIDGLRFVAILSVYLYHLSAFVLVKEVALRSASSRSIVAQLLGQGNVGVELFFVISGFILALPFASHYLRGTKRVLLRAYFLRRLTRLEPPYILSMLIFFLLLVAYVGKSAAALLPNLLASLSYTHNLIYGTHSTINTVAWSLEIEVQFYALVPILARVFSIRNDAKRRASIAVAIALSMFVQTVFNAPAESRFNLCILNFLQYFLCGFLLADFYIVDWQSAPTVAPRWDVVSLLGWPLVPMIWMHAQTSRWLLGPVTLVLYCAAFKGRFSRKFFSATWITSIGGMCYTIYLLHFQLISFVGRHTIGLTTSNSFAATFAWQFIMITPFVLGACSVYFLAIERPCMRPDWPARLMRKIAGGEPGARVV